MAFIRWLIIFLLFYSFQISAAVDNYPISQSLLDSILKKEVLWELEVKTKEGPSCFDPENMGPSPRKEEESLELISQDLVVFNFSNDVYLDTDPKLPPKWLSSVGEQYGFPLAMELGKFFRIYNLSFKVDLLGYYNQYLGLPGKEYAWRAQLQFFLPE